MNCRLVLFLIGTIILVGAAGNTVLAQTENLNVAVLVNSANVTGYNTSTTTPGEFQQYTQLYLNQFQVPYDIIDTATTPPPANLSSRQLILAGHSALALSPAWQQAISSAVQSGTGFVNLDSDLSIGSQTHIQTIFAATGAQLGTAATSVSVPAAVVSDGSAPHFITALQRRFLNDPVGDIVYNFHPDANSVLQTVTSTVLTTGQGTVIARTGNDPLILATSYGAGRAVNFGTYQYLKADRFGFLMGVDDLFWRSLVWAARKPFVLRGYPRSFAIQMDDTLAGWSTRVEDLYNPTYTGNTTTLGTGGPWKVTGYLFTDYLQPGTDDRATMIKDINAGTLQVVPHSFGNADLGNMYWNGVANSDGTANLSLSSPLSDSQWQNNLAAIQSWQQGLGGSDTVPKFSRSLVAHFWDLSNNTGYDLWNVLGFRYITSIQKPGFQNVYSNANVNEYNGAERLSDEPYRLYQLPPKTTRDENFPMLFADDYTVSSRAGLPPQTFFLFLTQYIDDNMYPRPDFIWPSANYSQSVAMSADQLERYTWRFWSSLAPVQIYTHDSNNYVLSTASDRQAVIQQTSAWLALNGSNNLFMQDLADYMYARTKSQLTSATYNGGQITYTFTGKSTDIDGNAVSTQLMVFQNDQTTFIQPVQSFVSGLTVTPPALPTVSSINPAYGPLGGGTNVTVTGSGFTSGSTVFFGGIQASHVNFVSSTSLVATTPAGSLGTVDVTITASNGSMNLPGAYSYLGPPQITRISPTSAPSTGGNILQIFGNSFTSDSTVSVGTVAATNVQLQGTTSITASIPPGAAGTTLNINVKNGNGTASLASSFTYLDPRSVLLQDSFNGDANEPQWTPSPLGLSQGWSKVKGTFAYSGIGHTQQYAGSAGWTDYDVETKILLFSTSNYPGGLRARVNPSTGSGYEAWLYPGSNTIALFRITGWNIDSPGLTELSSASVTFDATNFHTLRLSLHGSAIAVYWDNVQIMSANDSTYASGLIALDVSNQPIEFDDVLVTQPVQTSLTVSPPSIFDTGLGVTSQLKTIAGYLDGSTKDVTTNSATTYASSSLSVATVSTTGLVSSAGNGTSTITATYGGLSANSTITVNTAATPSVTSVSVSPTVFGLDYVGAAQQLAVTAFYNNGSSQSVTSNAGTTYTSSNTGVATVSATGLVTAVANGTATITASLSGFSATASVTAAITTAAPTISRVSPTEDSTAGGDNMDIYGANLTTQTTVSIGSANAVVLSVSGDGTHMTVQVPGGAAGSVNIGVHNSLGSATLTNGLTYVNTSSILFSDSFNSGTLNKWNASPLGLLSNWSATSDLADYNGGGPTQIFAGQATWSNYTVETKFQVFSNQNYPGGLRGRVNLTTGACYAVWIYPASNSLSLLYSTGWSIDSPGLEVLSSASVANMNPNMFHDLKLSFNGTQITVIYDGATVMQITDTNLSSGAIALDVSNQHIQYEDVFVTYNAAAPTISRVSPTEDSVVGGDNMDIYGTNFTTQTTVSIGGANALVLSASSDGTRMTVQIPGGAPGSVNVTASNSGGTATLANGLTYMNAAGILFSDSFNSGTLNNWNVSPLGLFSNWSATSDLADYNGGGPTQIFAGQATWSNYTVETKFQVFSDQNYPGGLRGRVNLSTGACYAVWIYPASNALKLLYVTAWDIDSPGLEVLSSTSVANMNPNVFHDLKLSFNGTQITVIYDGATVMQATDTNLSSGAIALDVSNQHIQYEDVFVTQP